MQRSRALLLGQGIDRVQWDSRVRTSKARAGAVDTLAAISPTDGGHAQVALTETWADKLRGTGIVVNSMHPGATRSAPLLAARTERAEPAVARLHGCRLGGHAGASPQHA